MKTVQEAEREWREAFNALTLALKIGKLSGESVREAEAWAEYRAALKRVIAEITAEKN